MIDILVWVQQLPKSNCSLGIIKIMKSKIGIKDISKGSQATIVGYKTAYGGYVGKLLSKGLKVGKTLTIVDSSSSENIIEVVVEKQLVSLSKPEADALYLTALKND